MPNWADGVVAMRGNTRTDIRNFILHFLFDNRKEVLAEYKLSPEYEYFPRAFLDVVQTVDFQDVINSITEDEDSKTFYLELNASFAWSASICLVDGKESYFREKDGSRSKSPLITLSEACAEHKVTVELYTEELGMDFNEHILVNSDGIIKIDEAYACPTGGTPLGDTDEDGHDPDWTISI